MATFTPGRILSRKANEDLRSRQYHYVKPGTVSGGMLLCVDGTVHPMGILITKPNVDEHGSVVMTGTALLVVADSSFGLGARIAPNSVGRGTLGQTDWAMGAIALDTVTAALNTIEVLLCPGGRFRG